ncbi:lipase 3-like [Schistocerca cancellata]|uniref:lipase 3-like n=1 Tax=Schistocerca cancellata TaxID=274614 RepID=UPI002118441C|nr:lipase 3-like [Schistocerca cancellata]
MQLQLRLLLPLATAAIVFAAAGTHGSFLSPVELARQHGYAAEEHRAVTADGHVLALHRILPRQSAGATAATAAPVVLLQHGVLASSLDWVIAGPDTGLAGYRLSDAGYDVWMGNLRGNVFSKEHLTLSTSDQAYWNYSWHEEGLLDIPALVEAALNATGAPRLALVGHSMGATAALAALALRPRLARHLHPLVLLAPVARLKHSTSIFTGTASLWPLLMTASRMGGVWAFPPDAGAVRSRMSALCRSPIVGRALCARFLDTVAGYTANLNMTLLPELFAHYPTQTSIKTMCHFMQLMASGRFSMFDHGADENQRVYGSAQPPEYPLHRVAAHTAVFYGDSDPFTTAEDMRWLASRLPKLMGSYLIPTKSFSHLSFLWSTDVVDALYDPLINFLNYVLDHNCC